uniref:Retrotransposon Copia-like N-terminal domain-containing protein n=1 Tax=Chenopodium quinoa TaxID=63459 RepID=A0A803L5I2_CHEQI
MLFNGSNFMIWSRYVKMALGAKTKMSLLKGRSVSRIQGTRIAIDGKEQTIWYSKSNIPLLFQLKKELGKLEQGEKMSVGEYYCKLKKLWDEIYNIEPIPECTYGILGKCTYSMYKKLLQIVERDRVMSFLMGLKKDYQNVKENIIGIEPLSTVNKAFHLVLQVEKQKEIIGEIQGNAELSAF